MTYNIHPIFVHFPIALLFIYSLIKILPVKRIFPKIQWKDVERILLTCGVIGAFFALSTGEAAEHLVRPNHQLVEMHALFASASTWLYGALLVNEFFEIVRSSKYFKSIPSAVQHIMVFINQIFANRAFVVCIAILGLVCICITGMLGGIITYGTTADPLAQPLLTILGISV